MSAPFSAIITIAALVLPETSTTQPVDPAHTQPFVDHGGGIPPDGEPGGFEREHDAWRPS